MQKNKRSLYNDKSNENQKEINERTSLKKLKKKKEIHLKKLINDSYLKLFLIYCLCLFSFLLLIIMSIFLFYFLKNKYFQKQILFIKDKDPEKEYEDSQEYMKMIKNGLLYDKDKIFYPTQNPKISIVLPVHNGEGFLNETILSIQNQDFKDIEIIVVDDQSTDNSVGLIKELMKIEPRISL